MECASVNVEQAEVVKVIAIKKVKDKNLIKESKRKLGKNELPF